MADAYVKVGVPVQRPGFPMGLTVTEPPVVRVDGEGQLEVAPDTAVVSLGFSARAEQAAAAFQQTAAAISRVIQALVAAGVPREQLQSEQISLFPVQERERVVGFEGTATLRVTLRDVNAVGPVIDRAVAAGANRVQGVSFEVRDPRPFEAQALTLAIQDAQRKAAILARAAGVGLGPIWLVEAEPSPGPVFPVAARAVALEAAIPVLPGTLTLIRRVRVEFVIQSA